MKTLELSVGQLNGTVTSEKHLAEPVKLLSDLHLHCWYKSIQNECFFPLKDTYNNVHIIATLWKKCLSTIQLVNSGIITTTESCTLIKKEWTHGTHNDINESHRYNAE